MFTVGGMNMSIKDLSKDELELYSHKDLTNMLLEEKGAMNTVDLFREITTLLELPNSVFETKRYERNNEGFIHWFINDLFWYRC